MSSSVLARLNAVDLTASPDGVEGPAIDRPAMDGQTMDTGSPAASGVPADVARHVLGGTSALGLGVLIERGTGFLANILAARLAGASAFGAYSLAISTANNISTYAAGQIGSTAARFSGKYPYGTRGYPTLSKALAIVSVTSAALGAFGLWLGARPIANLLGKPGLTGLLQWAVVSAVGIILLECARGFFVGQRRLIALVLLSVIVGAGMITLLPLAAHQHSPTRMIVSQGLITSTAVLVCLLFARQLGLFAPAGVGAPVALGRMLREIWSFGFVQLAGLIGSSLAGWWLTTLVVRGDTTLVQMSFFAIASQLRNLAGIAPGLLTEGSYAVMAAPDGEEESRTPHQVMALCSYASLSVAFVLACMGIVVVPWALRLLYGHTYDAAALATACGLAVAVVHMGNAPAAARLTIVSIRSTGVINTVWAIFVATFGSIFLFHHGSAARAMAIYFAAHLLAGGLVLLTLRRKDHVPRGMTASYLVGAVASGLLVGLAFLRNNARSPWTSTAAMLLVALVAVVALFLMGRRYAWLPRVATLRRLMADGFSRLNAMRRPRHV